jgi:hypothetical protein
MRRRPSDTALGAVVTARPEADLAEPAVVVARCRDWAQESAPLGAREIPVRVNVRRDTP